MLRKLLFVVPLLTVMLLTLAYGVSNNQRQAGPYFQPGYPPWLTDSSNEVSVSQLAAAYSDNGIRLELPNSLPQSIKLTSIHVSNPANPSGYAILTYSARGTKDFKYAEVDLEIIPASQPSQSDLVASATGSGGRSQLLSAGGIPVLLTPEAQNGNSDLQSQFGSSLYAMFWKGGVYYQLRAYRPLTVDDVLRMISSLQPVQ